MAFKASNLSLMKEDVKYFYLGIDEDKYDKNFITFMLMSDDDWGRTPVVVALICMGDVEQDNYLNDVELFLCVLRFTFSLLIRLDMHKYLTFYKQDKQGQTQACLTGLRNQSTTYP